MEDDDDTNKKFRNKRLRCSCNASNRILLLIVLVFLFCSDSDPDKLRADLAKLEQKLEDMSNQLALKVSHVCSSLVSFISFVSFVDRKQDETKEVSLGTSKINYMDPRVTVAWCKRTEVRFVFIMF